MARVPGGAWAGTRDERAIKLALAATLPGVDVASVIQTERTASQAQLQRLNRAQYAGSDQEGPEELAWALVVDSMIFATEAEVRWLDHVEQRLSKTAAPMVLELAKNVPSAAGPHRSGPTGDRALTRGVSTEIGGSEDERAGCSSESNVQRSVRRWKTSWSAHGVLDAAVEVIELPEGSDAIQTRSLFAR